MVAEKARGRRRTKTTYKVKVLAEIFKTFGGVLLVFSAVITFKADLPDEVENIIYFRGILLGSLLMIAGSAMTSNYAISQNILVVLGISNFMVLVASTYNLAYNAIIDLDLYFDIAIYSGLMGIVAIIIVRLWWRRHLQKKL